VWECSIKPFHELNAVYSSRRIAIFTFLGVWAKIAGLLTGYGSKRPIHSGAADAENVRYGVSAVALLMELSSMVDLRAG
jgi:hypothetical protein